MSEDWRRRVDHILARIESIERVLKGRKVSDVEEDEISMAALERHIFIIGEAASYLPDSVTKNFPDIPWREISGMRNALAHGYDSIDSDRIVDTVIEDIEPLKAVMFEIKKRYF